MKHLFAFLILSCATVGASEDTTPKITSDFLKHVEIDGGNWRLSDDPLKGTVLELAASDPVPADPVRRPANVLWLKESVTLPLSFSMSYKSLVPEVKGADVCIMLQDQTNGHLVYIHLSNDSDGRVHQVIMHVNIEKGTRDTIQHQKRPAPMLTEEWNEVRITVDAKGVLSVYSDLEKQPRMTALLPSVDLSKLGIGSFNDPARFDL